MSTQPACHNCIYAWWDKGQALVGFAIGFPSRPKLGPIIRGGTGR